MLKKKAEQESESKTKIKKMFESVSCDKVVRCIDQRVTYAIFAKYEHVFVFVNIFIKLSYTHVIR